MGDFKLKRIKQFQKYHKHYIFFLQFSKNEKVLFSGSKDKTLRLMNLQNFEVMAEYPFVDNVFCCIEYHVKDMSRIFVSGKNNRITRKFHIAEDIRALLIGRFLFFIQGCQFELGSFDIGFFTNRLKVYLERKLMSILNLTKLIEIVINQQKPL